MLTKHPCMAPLTVAAAILIAISGCQSDGSPSVGPADDSQAAGMVQAGSGSTAVGEYSAAPASSVVQVPSPDATGPVQTPGASDVAVGPGATPAAPAQAIAPAPASGGDDPWCGALSVFRSACHACHGEELVGGAPMPLVNYADMQAPAVSDATKRVHELIGPRVRDIQRPMPPVSHPKLTEVQVGAIDTWLAGGAQDGLQACAEQTPATTVEEGPQWPEDCEESYEIRVSDQDGSPYVVPADTEETRDFMIPVPWAGSGSGSVQAIAIRPLTANKRVVHHWILYGEPFDFITSWSPGKPVEVFPTDVGVHMPSSGSFRLNMHYYNIGNLEGEPDESGLEVCVTRKPRQYTATTFMFAGSATVPPGSRVENQSVCDVVASEPVHLMTSSPHMHSYGVHAKLEILRTDGSVEVVEDAPFNWEDQHITNIDAVVETGDQVRITCVYENNSQQVVRFGSSSADEMCFNFARYYPMDAFQCTSFGFGGR